MGRDMNVKCKILNVKCKTGIKEIKSSFSHEKPRPQPLSNRANREGSKQNFFTKKQLLNSYRL